MTTQTSALPSDQAPASHPLATRSGRGSTALFFSLLIGALLYTAWSVISDIHASGTRLTMG